MERGRDCTTGGTGGKGCKASGGSERSERAFEGPYTRLKGVLLVLDFLTCTTALKSSRPMTLLGRSGSGGA